MSVSWSKQSFDNSFAKELPGFIGPAIKHPMQTPGVLYANAHPEAVSKPELLTWSDDAAALLDLPSEIELKKDSERLDQLTHIFAGNELAPGMQAIATRYGGHQFGNWAGQLGDGRAISLGEFINSKNERWEIQLKGAGRTAYSRHADGRAVLRSSLREFICSESMFYLGIPTTRALCCVTTGDDVMRDMFYDGNPEAEPGAITTRLAPSFIRFGHFEILASTGELENLKALIRYTIRMHYPAIWARFDEAKPDEGIVEWFKEISDCTAKLIVDWLRVGFVHGVLNTDNMSILGLTIDYGPYGWLDSYDPTWTPNTTDFERRRYRFEQQPGIGLWNLTRLAEALSTVVQDKKALESVLETYVDTFQMSYRDMRMHKIGLIDFNPTQDGSLIDSLDQALTSTEIDMTIFYRKLADAGRWNTAEVGNHEFILESFAEAFYSERPSSNEHKNIIDWIQLYHLRINREPKLLDQRIARMNATNPVFVPRNYQVQEVLDDLEKGQHLSLKQMMEAFKTPYVMNSATTRWFRKRPEWARKRPGCSALSCSS